MPNKTTIKAAPKLDKSGRYVGLKEIGMMLNLTTGRAFAIARDHKDFPKPIATLKMGRVWGRIAVENWIKKHPNRKVGRPPKKR